MSLSSDLTLFGVDLARFWRSFQLGVRQLFYGEEAGIHAVLFPAARVVLDDIRLIQAGDLELEVDKHGDSSTATAFVLPEDLTLRRLEKLPSKAEIYIEEAIAQLAAMSSPFESGDTVWGWRLVSRDEASLEIDMAIASRRGISEYLQHLSEGSVALADGAEIWASGDNPPIVMRGFGEGQRVDQYQRILLELGAKFALALLIGLLVLFLPSAWLSIKAGQLEAHLYETENRAGSVTATRSNLVNAQNSLSGVQTYFEDRLLYHDWLNAIANFTPDNVYFYRMSLESDQLTVNGFAENAADYQGRLAASGLFSDLFSPTAFAFDSRAGLERFTLTMSFEAVER